MKIMPVSGNDVGFSPVQLKRIESVLRKKICMADDALDNYFDDLNALPKKSITQTKIETNEQAEVVRSPNSLWGGKETNSGLYHDVSVTVILEGKVRYPYDDTDQNVSAEIARDFDENWENNDACFEAVNGVASQLYGDAQNKEIFHSTVVSSISKTGDKTYLVTITLSATISSQESAFDAEERRNIEKADMDYHNSRDEGLI
jgi:hypothetical protein